MTVWIKQGVMGDLAPIAVKGLNKINLLFEKAGEDLYITSIREGNHIAGSFHYIGLAFDFLYGDDVNTDDIIKVLGREWDVVFEDNYIHVEYDPEIV